jgi:hypothetical protein
MVDLAAVSSEVDEKVKTVLHPPKVDELVKKLQMMPFQCGELKELTENADYLRDIIMDLPQVETFTRECDSIADQTFHSAQSNI